MVRNVWGVCASQRSALGTVSRVVAPFLFTVSRTGTHARRCPGGPRHRYRLGYHRRRHKRAYAVMDRHDLGILQLEETVIHRSLPGGTSGNNGSDFLESKGFHRSHFARFFITLRHGQHNDVHEGMIVKDANGSRKEGHAVQVQILFGNRTAHAPPHASGRDKTPHVTALHSFGPVEESACRALNVKGLGNLLVSFDVSSFFQVLKDQLSCSAGHVNRAEAFSADRWRLEHGFSLIEPSVELADKAHRRVCQRSDESERNILGKPQVFHGVECERGH